MQNIDELLRSRYGETSLDSGGASGAVTGAHQSYTLLFGDNADEAPMCQQGDVSSKEVVHENTEKCNDPKRSHSKKHQNKKSRGKETGGDEDADTPEVSRAVKGHDEKVNKPDERLLEKVIWSELKYNEVECTAVFFSA